MNEENIKREVYKEKKTLRYEKKNVKRDKHWKKRSWKYKFNRNIYLKGGIQKPKVCKKQILKDEDIFKKNIERQKK